MGLPGSMPPRCSARRAGPAEPDMPVTVSLHLRARPDSPGLGWVNRQALRAPAERVVLSREQLAERHGALESDVADVRAWVERCGLRVEAVHPGRRRMVVSGTLGLLQRAFGTVVCMHACEGGAVHLGREGALFVPSAIAPLLRAVLGLDGCLRVWWGEFEAADSLVCAVVPPGAATECAAVDAVIDAVFDAERRGMVMVLGFGAPEGEWSVQGMRVVEQTLLGAAAMGVTAVAPSPGDAVWFPATAPHAIACGVAGCADAVSAVFPGRTVPDVRGDVLGASDGFASVIRRDGYPLGAVPPLGSGCRPIHNR
jgi:Pro-kumamolisin, activation domain